MNHKIMNHKNVNNATFSTLCKYHTAIAYIEGGGGLHIFEYTGMLNQKPGFPRKIEYQIPWFFRDFPEA